MRIGSLLPSATEILFALALALGTGVLAARPPARRVRLNVPAAIAAE